MTGDRMHESFAKKVAIVMGGGASGDGIGIGRAASILLARQGATVVVADRSSESAHRTVQMIASEGGHGQAVSADATSEADCSAVVDAALSFGGRLDLLVNNVGVPSTGSVAKSSVVEWRRVMQTNVDSIFLLSRAAIPAMCRTANGGAIVNVSSISALRPRGMTAYSASKGAVISLTRAMAVDHGVDGVRVNCVLPGAVHTPLAYGAGMSESAREARRKASVLGIEGTG